MERSFFCYFPLTAWSKSWIKTQPKMRERSCKLSVAILQCSWFLRLEERSMVFSRFCFTGSRFVHAAFWPKSKSEKSCLVEQIFAKREKFFDHALRLVNDFLTLKSSFWLNCTYSWPFLAIFRLSGTIFLLLIWFLVEINFYSILYWNVNLGNWYQSVLQSLKMRFKSKIGT